MERKIFEYLRDILTPTGKRGNVSYNAVCRAFNISQLEFCEILQDLISAGKISANISTYGCYIILK